MPVTPSDPLTLPCGAILPNRLMKSAMSEALASVECKPTERHNTLYRRWAEGGVGLCVTGNVMVDRRALGEPGNVVLQDDQHLDAFRAWAQAGTAGGTALWMQINHPGKQVPKGLNREAVSPSAIPFGPELRSYFNTPRELTAEEIEALIERYARSASLAQQAGFTGVQIHGAHGYLVSQFLSAHHNQRTDAWGGSAERRMRFVLEVYGAMRAAVGDGFPVSIKLNSADFQKGGFTEEESLAVVSALSEKGMDLIEISGGTYEAPVMATGPKHKDSTRRREAYFLEFAEKARDVARAPIAVTGGFRSRAGIEEALAGGALDVVGLARSLALDPEFPHHVLRGEDVAPDVGPVRTGIGPVDRSGLMNVAWYARQLKRMGDGGEPNPDENKKLALLGILTGQGLGVLRMRLRA